LLVVYAVSLPCSMTPRTTAPPPPLLPADEHNRALVDHVHPADWRNPTPDGRYNLVVIGGGTAGLVTAAGAAGLGAKVALVERHLMGGDCLNFGCVPSKGLIAAARRAAGMRYGGEFGVTASDVRVDFATAMERMRKVRAGIGRHDSVRRFAGLGVDVFLGQARFTGQNSVAVGEVELDFHTAVIATGARAAVPPIPGLSDVPFLTNEILFSLTELPRRLAVIGAGPIGCEMAQCFARLGSEVFLVESASGILPREDRDAALIVQEQMKRDGVKVLCCGKELQLSRGDGSTVRLKVESESHGYEITVDTLLVAAGRAPNIEGLGLEAAGVAYDTKGVKVDDTLRTTNPRIFACGDICSSHQFTHSADFQARIVIQNALFFGRKKTSSLIIPWATYTSPEVAHVGLYEREAREQGIAVTTFTQPFSEVDRALLDGESEGFVRVHVRTGTDEIIGATIVAEHAGDLISELTLAMTHKIGLGRIAKTIHPYPTQADAIRKLGDQYNRSRLTPKVKALMTQWLAWRRG
jgi:pyruvate/2-oxoglutarate dehydrogenase complex dihydrolipoamide dehydrogenase (E3) component